MLRTFRQLLALFDRDEKRRFRALLALMVFVGMAELVGISTILVLLRVLTSPEAVIADGPGAWLYATLGFSGIGAFQVAMAVGVVAVFCIALVVRAVGTFAMIHFAQMRSFSLSTRLLQSYLSRPYAWFLRQNSAELRKTALDEVNQLVMRCLTPFLRMLASVIIVVLILVFLLAFEPLVSLAAFAVLGGAYGVIYVALRGVLFRLSRALMEQNSQRFRLAEEATGGFKEVKLKGAEADFIDRFRDPARRWAELQTMTQLAPAMPRFVIEGVSFAGMVALIMVLLLRDSGQVEGVFPVVGVFAFASVRLLPALQQIFHGAASIRASHAVLDRVHADLTAPAPPLPQPDVAPAPAPMLTRDITLRDVSFAYDGAARPALENVTLTMPALQTIGFVGGTGAGKSTLIDIVLGLLLPDDGQVEIDGTPLTEATRHGWQRRIGYVPQSIYLTDDTVANNIAFGLPADRVDRDAVERAASMAALHDFVTTELPRGYDTMVGERGVRLSGGQRQRIGIARALYSDPDLLVMDEATSALDTLTERAVMEAVANVQGRKTILLIAHRLTTVRECDVIHMLDHGRVVASGRYDDLVSDNAVFRRMATGG